MLAKIAGLQLAHFGMQAFMQAGIVQQWGKPGP